MRNLLIILTLFLTAIPNLYSQKNSGSEQRNNSSYITFSPLSPLDFYAPRLRAGYIQHLAYHWKIGLDIGIGAGTGLLSRRASEDDILWGIRPEIYYVLKPTSRTIKYLSTEFFYIDQSNVLLNNTYNREDGVAIGYDRADYTRQKYGMHLKFGLFLNLGRHWGFNFYGGIGFRWKTTSFDNLVNAREETFEHHRHGFDTIYNSEGSGFRPNPALGFKVYYRL